MNEQLIVFLKNPIAGKVKTRLAKDIGAEKALKIYKWLVHLTLDVVSNVKKNVTLFFDEAPQKKELLFPFEIQFGENLGLKMTNALKVKLSEGPTVLIGSDCPEISSKLIESAFMSLKVNDLVVGPAQDGGFYLIGMSHYHEGLFNQIEWGSSTVYSVLFDNIQKAELSCSVLQTLSDIDRKDDFVKYESAYELFQINQNVIVED